jgi:hypothetical protein
MHLSPGATRRTLSQDIVHDDAELMAAIGRMVVNAAELEYAVAELAATAEGLREEECRERATAIVRRTGEAMRQFERLAHERSDLGGLMRDTADLLGARHFVAHAVPQQDAAAEGHPALFVLSPRQGETMITTGQAVSNAGMIREGTGRIRDEIATLLRDQDGGRPVTCLSKPALPC